MPRRDGFVPAEKTIDGGKDRKGSFYDRNNGSKNAKQAGGLYASHAGGELWRIILFRDGVRFMTGLTVMLPPRINTPAGTMNNGIASKQRSVQTAVGLRVQRKESVPLGKTLTRS
jgi:hypothetical protein